MNKWTKRYFEIAKLISTWSKDPSTKIGAVCVGSKGQILAQGYNGFPRGIKDTEARYKDRETKYQYIVHAELNTILNASLTGISLKGSSIYIHGAHVCSECAKAIIQSGIKKVYSYSPQPTPRWQQSFALTDSLLHEAGIDYQRHGPSEHA